MEWLADMLKWIDSMLSLLGLVALVAAVTGLVYVGRMVWGLLRKIEAKIEHIERLTNNFDHLLRAVVTSEPARHRVIGERDLPTTETKSYNTSRPHIEPAPCDESQHSQPWSERQSGESDSEFSLGYSADPVTSGRNADILSPTHPLEVLTRLYNDAVHDDVQRGDRIGRFNEKFPQQCRLGLINASERKKDETRPPVFEERSDGDYLAIALPDSTYAVVPRWGLVYSDTFHGPGAFGNVFDVIGYKPGSTYAELHLEHPAIFSRGAYDGVWRFKHQGMLQLTGYDGG